MLVMLAFAGEEPHTDGMVSSQRSGKPPPLPIWDSRDRILSALRQENRLVICAPTGSGKSTQVPQMLIEHAAEWGPVLVLQPRRLAARMLARRVARERGGEVGGEVGYQVRFDDRSGPATRIKYVTDGIALRMLLGDPRLRRVNTIVLDEFHERHACMDAVLALVKRLQATARPALRLIVMSATLDTERLAARLAPCATIETAGRAFPVTIEYLPAAPRADRAGVWDSAARAFEVLSRSDADGDVLVFMPGAYEIRRTIEALRRTRAGGAATILPLHGAMRPEDQDAALKPCERRKVVVATNVAETSITIDGITAVIDSGLERAANFDPRRGINTLLIEKISRASAEQRAGRAGRTRPGRCLRLWSEREHALRPARATPEVQRIDLSELLLVLYAAGVADVEAFDWPDPPDPLSLERALRLLADLGAIDERTREVTPLGRRLASFPVHPRIGAMLIAAERYGCVPTAARLAALIQERSILLPRQNRDVRERRERELGDAHGSDVLRALRAWEFAAANGFQGEACARLGIHGAEARRVAAAAAQIADTAKRIGLDGFEHAPHPESLLRCILTGFSDQVGCLSGAAARRYALVHKRRGTLDRESAAQGAALVVATEISEIGSGRGEVEVRLAQVSAIRAEWLRELFPAAFRHTREVLYDPQAKQVVAREYTLFHDLAVEEGRGAPPGEEERAALLAEQVLQGNIVLKHWNHQVEQWVSRVNLLADRCPDFGVPAIDEVARRDLLTHLCLGACGAKEVRTRPVWPVVRAWLSAAQQDVLERMAPDRLTLSNGRRPRVTYDGTNPPVIALRIQELYDVTGPVTVAAGRIRVQIHVLAPNHRPVQITDDLDSFWKHGYERVKKDLRGRYPKHEWR